MEYTQKYEAHIIIIGQQMVETLIATSCQCIID